MRSKAKVHRLGCQCWWCTAQALGTWFDDLAAETELGVWLWFLTITYAEKPSAGFGGYCFEAFISQLSSQLGARVDYVLSDQYGRLNDRYHQHALLSARGLRSYPRSELEAWFRRKAGWCRALPFRNGAAYYLANYIGRHLETADWQLQVGNEIKRAPHGVGRTVIVASAELPSGLFHQNFRGRKR
jgi:hypothetical protein